MLVFFSARRLKPGSFDQFRRAWQPGEGQDDLPDGAVAIYHARNRKDPDEVISFGIFDLDDPAAVRGDEQAELKMNINTQGQVELFGRQTADSASAETRNISFVAVPGNDPTVWPTTAAVEGRNFGHHVLLRAQWRHVEL